LSIDARVMSTDGRTCLQETAVCEVSSSDPVERAGDLGRQVAAKLKAAGAEALIHAARPAGT